MTRTSQPKRLSVGEFLATRLGPALLVVHGSAILGALLCGVTESSAASKVFWMTLPVAPGAFVGLLGLRISPFDGGFAWVPGAVVAGLVTFLLLRLVDRARTWDGAKGIPVLLIVAVLSGLQAGWLTLMMRA